MRDVRENLKNFIIDGGYKQIVIAQKAKLTPAKLSGILNKSRKLDVNEMVILCEVLGITPEELLNYKPTMQNTANRGG